MCLIESGLALAALLIAFTYPSLGSVCFERLERNFSELSQRRVSVALVGFLALVMLQHHSEAHVSVLCPARSRLILAAGKLAFGHPLWGVWLSMGIMCAAITWALQDWMASRWAVLRGLLAMLRLVPESSKSLVKCRPPASPFHLNKDYDGDFRGSATWLAIAMRFES